MNCARAMRSASKIKLRLGGDVRAAPVPFLEAGERAHEALAARWVTCDDVLLKAIQSLSRRR
jgi:hypothetical protein